MSGNSIGKGSKGVGCRLCGNREGEGDSEETGRIVRDGEQIAKSSEDLAKATLRG